MDEENQNLNTGLDGTQQVNNQYAQPNNMQYNGQYVPPQQNNQYNPNVGQQQNNQYNPNINEQYNNQYNPNMNGQYNNQYNPNMNGQYNNQYNPNMNGQYNNQPNQNISNNQGEKAPTILRIVCFFFPLIGLILYCCNLSSNKPYALSCGKPALAGFLTGIGISVFMFILGFIITFTAAMAI